MEILNIKEFKELLELYKSITEKDIDRAYQEVIKNKVIEHNFGFTVMKYLTGFGGCDTCTLCVAVNNECIHCVYNVEKKSTNVGYSCLHDKSEPSYNAITQSYDSRALLKAIKERIKFMKSLEI